MIDSKLFFSSLQNSFTYQLQGLSLRSEWKLSTTCPTILSVIMDLEVLTGDRATQTLLRADEP